MIQIVGYSFLIVLLVLTVAMWVYRVNGNKHGMLWTARAALVLFAIVSAVSGWLLVSGSGAVDFLVAVLSMWAVLASLMAWRNPLPPED